MLSSEHSLTADQNKEDAALRLVSRHTAVSANPMLDRVTARKLGQGRGKADH